MTCRHSGNRRLGKEEDAAPEIEYFFVRPPRQRPEVSILPRTAPLAKAGTGGVVGTAAKIWGCGWS